MDKRAREILDELVTNDLASYEGEVDTDDAWRVVADRSIMDKIDSHKSFTLSKTEKDQVDAILGYTLDAAVEDVMQAIAEEDLLTTLQFYGDAAYLKGVLNATE